jgi:predicted secreted hydrolase
MAGRKPKTDAGGVMKIKQFYILLFALSVLFLKQVSAEVPEFTQEGFRVPQPYQTLVFPRDHGSHPDFKIEWWYLTGHLQADSERAFGFQVTFFRFAGPIDKVYPDSPYFGQSHIHSTQVALTDIETGEFYFDERLDRNGWDAFASEEGLDLKHGPWTMKMIDESTETIDVRFHIRDKAALNLQMSPTKPKVIFGPDGTSRKGSDPAARSYYITFTRMAVFGDLKIDGETLDISGEAWIDHEISSQQLSENLEGWDWTAIQLNDGREIKAYLLRQTDGTPSEFSQLIWIDESGNTVYQNYGNSGFTWTKQAYWESPVTGTAYPTTVTLNTPDPKTGLMRQLTLNPTVPDQELTGDLNGTNYWEGACRVTNDAGETVGRAYLELAGYDESLSGALR